MFRRSSFLLWVLCAVAIAVLPVACGSSDTNTQDGTMSVTVDAMTKS